MRLDSQVPPPYLPDGTQQTVLRLGLSSLHPADWLQPDADFARFHAHKADCLQHHQEQVIACLPSSYALQGLFADFLLEHLLHWHGDSYALVDGNLKHLPSGLRWPLADRSLAACSRWIQEDIVLLEPQGNSYRLAAASVCSPSNWRLEEKLGATLAAIHAPVPGYEAQLAARVDRLLAGLKADKPVSRINWSLQPGNELRWRDQSSDGDHKLDIYWRIERQSLLRLPAANAIIFSIRIYLHRLEDLLKTPGLEADLHNILHNLPTEQLTYKGLLSLRKKIGW